MKHKKGSAKWARLQTVHVLAALALIVAVPFAVAWVIGDFSETSTSPDYLIKPPHISKAAETAVGLGAVAIAVISLLVLHVSQATRLVAREWWLVLGLLLAVGTILAFGWRMVTAGVVGANIGGGMFILFGTPVIVGLLSAVHCKSCRMFRKTKNRP